MASILMVTIASVKVCIFIQQQTLLASHAQIIVFNVQAKLLAFIVQINILFLRVIVLNVNPTV